MNGAELGGEGRGGGRKKRKRGEGDDRNQRSLFCPLLWDPVTWGQPGLGWLIVTAADERAR